MYRLVNSDEKWIYFDSSTRTKHWTDPGKFVKLNEKRNLHVKKVFLCIWRDKNGMVCYELLKPGQTITGERYKQQFIEMNCAKRPEWANRRGRVMLLYDNSHPHVAKPVKETLEAFEWDVTPPAFSKYCSIKVILI